MVYETITFENINEFVDSLEIKNKDNFTIDFSHTNANFIGLSSNDKDDFVRFNIVAKYHNTNRNGELMFSKQNLTNFKNKIKLIETIFEFKKFITSDMNVEFIFVKNNNDFNIKLTSNVVGTSKTIAVKATDDAMTHKVVGGAELDNARGEEITWDFYGETFGIDTTDLTSQEIITKIMTTSQAGIAKFDANVKILEQVLNHN